MSRVFFMEREDEPSIMNALKRFPVTQKKLGQISPAWPCWSWVLWSPFRPHRKRKANHGVSAAKMRAGVAWPRVQGWAGGLAEKLRLPARFRSRKNCVETWVLVYA